MKKRILLVDDAPAFTQVIQRHLESTGSYEVRAENDSTKALAVAQEFQPQLILLDVIMPDMDGGEVAAQLRADPHLRHVPIVFLTGIVSKEMVGRQGDVIGGHPFLAKPVDAGQVIRCVEERLRGAA